MGVGMMKLLKMMVVAAAVSVAGAAHASMPNGDPDAGARKNAMCIGCHGIAGFKTGFPRCTGYPSFTARTPST